MLKLCKDIEIDNGYKFDDFKKSMLYEKQEDNSFFWLENIHNIVELGGEFKVGLWFEDGKIRQIQLLYIDRNNFDDEKKRKSKHQEIIREKIPNIDLRASRITNYWDT